MAENVPAHAYYGADIADFLTALPAAILGRIAEKAQFDIDLAQRNAWLDQIEILKAALPGVDGAIFLEFIVPRLGSRIDAVLVGGPILFVIEFKVGADQFTRQDYDQVWDYALDLKNFHKASHDAAIIPILVATNAKQSDSVLGDPYNDRVYRPARCNAAGLAHLINVGLETIEGVPIDAAAWSSASYLPTPTIIEAAQALYSRHSVEDIARHDAGTKTFGLRPTGWTS